MVTSFAGAFLIGTLASVKYRDFTVAWPLTDFQAMAIRGPEIPEQRDRHGQRTRRAKTQYE